MTTLKYSRKSRKWRQETTATATGNRSGRCWGGGTAALSTDRAPIRARDSRNCKTRNEEHLRQLSCYCTAACSALPRGTKNSQRPLRAGKSCKEEVKELDLLTRLLTILGKDLNHDT